MCVLHVGSSMCDSISAEKKGVLYPCEMHCNYVISARSAAVYNTSRYQSRELQFLNSMLLLAGWKVTRSRSCYSGVEERRLQTSEYCLPPLVLQDASSICP